MAETGGTQLPLAPLNCTNHSILPCPLAPACPIHLPVPVSAASATRVLSGASNPTADGSDSVPGQQTGQGPVHLHARGSGWFAALPGYAPVHGTAQGRAQLLWGVCAARRSLSRGITELMHPWSPVTSAYFSSEESSPALLPRGMLTTPGQG